MQSEFKPENLTVGGPMVEAQEVVTLKAGEKVVRGEVLAKTTEGYVAWTSGSDATRVASEDADATAGAGAVNVSVFKGGNFNFNGLTLPEGTEASAISDTLWMNNMHVATNISGGL